MSDGFTITFKHRKELKMRFKLLGYATDVHTKYGDANILYLECYDNESAQTKGHEVKILWDYNRKFVPTDSLIGKYIAVSFNSRGQAQNIQVIQ